MNRKNLTAAVLAGLAGAAGIVGSAQAVNVNPDGLGQVLLYPYYTTNGGNQTLLSVVNTTGYAKAVKVRFLEGQNSREVLDFNLYMSAFDVWTASIFDDGGAPTLRTGDTTCTVPYIYGDFGGVQEFLPWALTDENPAWADDASNPDAYPDVTVRGSEGHFEMIEMGTMLDQQIQDPDEDADPGDMVAEFGSAAAATHDGGVPADCQQLVDAWTRSTGGDGYWIDDNFADMEAPSGGLFGGAAIVNVQRGTMYSYDAKAINGFADSVAGNQIESDDMHQEPGTILPSLDSGGILDATVFDDDGLLLTATLDRGVDAVSYVLMHDQLMNEYTTESGVGAKTEWVITFPTKQFYVHQALLDDYVTDFRPGTDPYYRTYMDADDEDFPDSEEFFIPNDPFTSTWTWVPAKEDADGDETAPAFVDFPCEVVTIDSIWDREENDPAGAPPGPDRPPVVSPRPPADRPDGLPSFSLCFETQVIVFGEIDEGSTNAESDILGSSNVTTVDNVALGFEFGWMRLGLSDASHDTDQDGDVDEVLRAPLGNSNDMGLLGLPVTGFAVQQFENSFLGAGADTLANYGGIFQHKGTRLVSAISTGSSATDNPAVCDDTNTGPADSPCRPAP